MAISNEAATEYLDRAYSLNKAAAGKADANMRSPNSAVSWGSIAAGAATVAALSLILLMLGFWLGMSPVSPWAWDGVTAATFGLSTILWLTLIQLLASALGGYLAGRHAICP